MRLKGETQRGVTAGEGCRLYETQGEVTAGGMYRLCETQEGRREEDGSRFKEKTNVNCNR